MRKIAVFLTKGGVGKTTTAVNTAAGLARLGAKVLLIDTDTQGHVSMALGLQPSVGLAQVLSGEFPVSEAIIEARERLWLLAGGSELAGAKRLIARKDFGGEHTLREIMTPLENTYEYVIIDTAPGWDPVNVNVLFYVDEILTKEAQRKRTRQLPHPLPTQNPSPRNQLPILWRCSSPVR